MGNPLSGEEEEWVSNLLATARGGKLFSINVCFSQYFGYLLSSSVFPRLEERLLSFLTPGYAPITSLNMRYQNLLLPCINKPKNSMKQKV